ncbi:hypothetical protein J6590_026100 [Homalodisca vitripennis]|nr:hypothetical protein J6590_026100 [Homalodisca vitripennis]
MLTLNAVWHMSRVTDSAPATVCDSDTALGTHLFLQCGMQQIIRCLKFTSDQQYSSLATESFDIEGSTVFVTRYREAPSCSYYRWPHSFLWSCCMSARASAATWSRPQLGAESGLAREAKGKSWRKRSKRTTKAEYLATRACPSFVGRTMPGSRRGQLHVHVDVHKLEEILAIGLKEYTLL